MKLLGQIVIGFSVGWLMAETFLGEPKINNVAIGAIIGLTGAWICALKEQP